MVRSGEKLLNDFIIFLTICQSGLGLEEAEIVLNNFSSELSPKEKARTIKLYIDLFKEEAAKVSAVTDQILDSSFDDMFNEKNERLESLKDLI